MSQPNPTRQEDLAVIMATCRSMSPSQRLEAYAWMERKAAAIVAARRRDELRAQMRVIRGGK